MTVPARLNAAAEDQARKLDPRKLIWADVRTAIITCARAATLAVTELASRPGDEAALEMAGLTRQAFENAAELGRRWVLDEAILEDVRQRAYNEGVADCKASRCRLAAVPDLGAADLG